MNRPATLALTALLLTACGGSAPPVEGLPAGTLVIETSSGEVLVEVAIAETDEARIRGLMGVEEMAEDAGMVFLVQEPSVGSFWMKDTLIPLSIAFWDEENTIRAILDMEPCREDPCRLYEPGVAWVGAVEVNQGFFAEHGVELGDRVRLERYTRVGRSARAPAPSGIVTASGARRPRKNPSAIVHSVSNPDEIEKTSQNVSVEPP